MNTRNKLSRAGNAQGTGLSSRVSDWIISGCRDLRIWERKLFARKEKAACTNADSGEGKNKRKRSFIYGELQETARENRVMSLRVGKYVRKFNVNNCTHILKSGDTAWKDMSKDVNFMNNFKKGFIASQKAARPELSNPGKLPSPQKIRKLMLGARVYVCRICGNFYIGEKNNVPDRF